MLCPQVVDGKSGTVALITGVMKQPLAFPDADHIIRVRADCGVGISGGLPGYIYGPGVTLGLHRPSNRVVLRPRNLRPAMQEATEKNYRNPMVAEFRELREKSLSFTSTSSSARCLGLQVVPAADPFPKEHWPKKMCVLVVSHGPPSSAKLGFSREADRTEIFEATAPKVSHARRSRSSCVSSLAPRSGYASRACGVPGAWTAPVHSAARFRRGN